MINPIDIFIILVIAIVLNIGLRALLHRIDPSLKEAYKPNKRR